MNDKQKDQFIKKNWHKLSNSELCKEVGLCDSQLRVRARKLGCPPKTRKKKQMSVNQLIQMDKAKRVEAENKKASDKKYQTVLTENERLIKDLEAALELKNGINPVSFKYRAVNKNTEAVAVVLASDWHIEEEVRAETVDGFNEYNLEIARERAEQFFQKTLKLVEIEQMASKIDTLVLALLGDFFSGNIHDALLEICQLEPIDAAIEAENLIIAGIQYILDNSNLNIIIPCHMGNHSRITKKVHIATEDGNSLEKFMYCHIKNHFKGNKRVKVLISPAYLSYLQIWDYTICFQHGHAVKYQGGIGGLTIPLKKAVAQWQKKRTVNLYCLGHWHTLLDIGEAIVNGSMIGYSSYVQFIKGDPERPKQAFFIVSKKFNEKIAVRSILFTV